MRISIFSLFRDSIQTVHECLKNLEGLEDTGDFDLSYFFYENDSIDGTPEILKEWIKSRDGELLSEKNNSPKYGSTLEPKRMLAMSNARNKMLSIDKRKDSEYSIIFDSDVSFSSNIINNFLNYKKLNFSMLTSNIRQNVPCKMGSGKNDSYYDSSILYDTNGVNCMTWSDNPFYEKSDRDNFEKGNPVEVLSAFGSFAFLKTSYLHKCKWSSKGESEHLSFCRDLRKYAPIYLIPNIRPTVNIEQKKWDHEDKVIEHQKKLLKNKWNRFLLKTNNLSYNKL
jgi:hypothetical protein